MDVLASALTLFGPIVVCCVAFYLRWQLADGGGESAGSGSAAPARAPSLLWGHVAARNLCEFQASPPRPPARNLGRGASLSSHAAAELQRSPGVYVAGGRDARALGDNAVIRGQLLADRIINGRFDARQARRRGKKGALDVIVVGANALGVSATLHLMSAGLRVLLVDRDDATAHASLPGVLRRLGGKLRDARLPFLGGHSVSALSQRADGMLEVQAERAGWYAANVIFAVRCGMAAPVQGVVSVAGVRHQAA